MRSSLGILCVLACCAAAWADAAKTGLAGTAERNRQDLSVVYVDYSGPAPDAASPYLDRASWQVYWSSGSDGPLHRIGIDGVTIDPHSQMPVLQLRLSGETPPLDAKWTVLFAPASALPQVIQGTTPKGGAEPGQPLVPPQSASGESATATKASFFKPSSNGGTPDVSLSASFLAAGGTKPIYALEVKGTVVAAKSPLGFHPGLSADIAINQNTTPPVNKTTFSPDSITAGLAFKRVLYLGSLQEIPPSAPPRDCIVCGAILQMNLPKGEFSASDPSSNIVFNPTATLVLNSWQPGRHTPYFGTFYPFFALEAGNNLSKPSTVNKVAVHFSNYDAIVRGVLGADAVFAKDTPDRTAQIFSITGSYRVRLPAFDEPQVRTFHQKTAVTLGTNARHWFEGNINYSPWSFKYLALTGKYQYGELPPLFKQVDHKFTIGLTLQANQTAQHKKP
jgi:hypothetical protein